MELCDKLRLLRKERKLTQEEVGKAIGQERSTVACYETGKRTPDIATLEKLAVLYKVTLDYFASKSSGDVMVELLARTNAFFSSNGISDEDKDSVYRDVMRLYLQSKEYQGNNAKQNIKTVATKEANKN